MSELIRRALTEMADEARKADVVRNLARTALNDAIYFGRSQDVIDDLARKLSAMETPEVRVEVPGPVLDPVSVEYAAVGGPRSWAERRVMQSAGEAALENADSPSNAAIDAVRSNALMRSRLDRLSPEQRAQSMAAVAFQAQDDARAAAIQRAAASERRRVQTKAATEAMGKAALRYGVPGAAVGALGYGAYDVAGKSQQRAADDKDYMDRLAFRRAVRERNSADLMDAMDDMGQDIVFDSGVPSIENAAAGLARVKVPSMDDLAPDIFTEDPAISFDNESPSEAISRILLQRYGR